MKQQKTINKIITIFIFLLPIIDIVTSIFTWEGKNFSPGIILKGIFLLYAIFYLLKNYKNKKIFIPLIFYGIINIIYLFRYNANIFNEITNLIKIFYLPILILFFSIYDNKQINRKALFMIFTTYLLLYLVPFFLGIGHNASEIASNRELYLSYFYIGNELASVFILLLPIVITYLIKSNNYLLKGLYAILILFLIILMGTKAFYLSLIIILIYFLITYHKKIFPFLKRNRLKTLVSILVILVALIAYIPHLDLTKSLKNTLDYYEINSVKEIFTLENIDNVIFNSRLTYLKNVNELYQNSTPLEKLMGLGKTQIASLKEIEIDVFDIYYSIGLIGFIFYLYFFIYALKHSKLKKDYKFSFILLLIVSCFTGHILISPFTSSILALLFLANKNEEEKHKKSILLVTNMYPNKDKPHYGIFVKNTYELLVNEGFNVTLIKMNKTDNKLFKIFNYVIFMTKSFIKPIFNNYDYIYTHFISHSTIGVFIPYLTSKNTKLILNAHGNDIIADTKIDEKNIIRSKKFLKHADYVIAPSKYFEQILIKNYQVPKAKIVIYPSGGVDLTKFKNKPKAKALKDLSLSSKYKYFGYVSRIEKDKGYDILIQAINELKKQKKLENIRFLIVGDGNESSVLEDLIKQYKLKKYIIRKNLVSQDELVNIYNAIEALIYPTRRKSESLGLTGLEAMACETLVIGSNKFGPSTYLENQVNSLTFDPNNYLELTDLILKTLKMKVKDKNILTKQALIKAQTYSNENTQNIILKVFKE